MHTLFYVVNTQMSVVFIKEVFISSLSHCFKSEHLVCVVRPIVIWYINIECPRTVSHFCFCATESLLVSYWFI